MVVDPRLVLGSTWAARHYNGARATVTYISSDRVRYTILINGWSDHAPIDYFLRNWSYVPDMDTELEYL